MPPRQIAGAGHEERKTLRQARQDCSRGKHLDPSRSELDRQWEPVEAAADIGDDPAIVPGERKLGLNCLRTRNKEPRPASAQ